MMHHEYNVKVGLVDLIHCVLAIIGDGDPCKAHLPKQGGIDLLQKAVDQSHTASPGVTRHNQSRHPLAASECA